MRYFRTMAAAFALCLSGVATAACQYGEIIGPDTIGYGGGEAQYLIALSSGDLASCTPEFVTNAAWLTLGQVAIIDRPPDQFVYHGYEVTVAVAANAGVARVSPFILADHSLSMAQGAYPIVAQPDTRILVREYYLADFNHYFMTADLYEQQLLGKPPFADWQPTGRAFTAYEWVGCGLHCPGKTGLALPVCRYYNDTVVPSTHFYGLPEVCDQVAQFFLDWKLEDYAAFGMGRPNDDGGCPIETPVAVYRLYNNGNGGVPNHRFVTSVADRDTMLSQGWISEGAGPLGVGFCGPISG